MGGCERAGQELLTLVSPAGCLWPWGFVRRALAKGPEQHPSVPPRIPSRGGALGSLRPVAREQTRPARARPWPQRLRSWCPHGPEAEPAAGRALQALAGGASFGALRFGFLQD